MKVFIFLLLLLSSLTGFSQLKTFQVLGYRQCQYNPNKGEWGEWGRFYKTMPEDLLKISFIDSVNQKIVIDSIHLRIISEHRVYSSIGFEPNRIALSVEYPCIYKGDTISFSLINNKFEGKYYFDLVFRDYFKLEYLVKKITPPIKH